MTILSCGNKKEASLHIAAAANTQFAMEALTHAFEKEIGIPCELTFSSSGKLTAQITQGAPYDIFLSADMRYPNRLHQEGLTTALPEVYARGQLVLWTTIEGLSPDLSMLNATEVEHIALANPKTAPYGKAAMAVIKGKSNFENISPKLVFGESIAQTNQFIVTQAADIGFTALSVVKSPRMLTRGQWLLIPSHLYEPIEQGLVIMNRSDSGMAKAEQFRDFLFSVKGKQILQQFGYLVAEE